MEIIAIKINLIYFKKIIEKYFERRTTEGVVLLYFSVFSIKQKNYFERKNSALVLKEKDS